MTIFKYHLECSNIRKKLQHLKMSQQEKAKMYKFRSLGDWRKISVDGKQYKT